ncbi:CBS domain-containing protein [Actinoplanes sp. CA-051413]|uniref:CBS domain-containing protein n=1 Tax=Actinoplanes sp. CA-051413 TaxID=3239899 RepID=UPI003D979158
MQWQVDDVMTREVITVGVDTPVGQIAGLLDREGISAVPVTTPAGDVLGVVSQADLLAGVTDGKRRKPRGKHLTSASAARAGDVMTTPALSVGAEASLKQAARTMQSRNVRRLFVTGPQGRLLGVVTRGDLLRPYARQDAAIRREVEAVLRGRLWIRPEQVAVRVNEGTATLTGAVGRRSTAGIVTRLATAVPGVTEVVDRIGYDFDDAALARSRVDRTHPFSADPFRPGGRAA